MGKTILREMQKVELEILKEFLNICQKYDLQYFLLGGTLLGAIRHKGFIPWDDDIDVGMPRPDYDKFLSIAQGELPEKLFLQTRETDCEYPMNFAKIRNTETTFIEKTAQFLNINHGVYIDIFPLDGYPKSKVMQKLTNCIDAILKFKISKAFFSENYKESWKHRIIDALIKILRGNYKTATKQRDKFIRRYSYDKCEIVNNYCGAWGQKEIMPKDYFGKGIKGTFENLDVILPYKYDLYLTQLYGDYMTPPPKEKQIGHHYYTIIDLDKSYKKYFEE